MRLLNYIKGDTRGNASREIERRSLCDPFLSDAIDGYEHRAGKGAEHIRNIAELERDINDRKLIPRRQWPVFIYMCILLLIVCAVIITNFMI